jgi:hypothetical protein
LVQGKDSFETEGGVGRKKQEENGVELSTAVCIEEKVERVSLLPVKNIRRPHTVLILRPLAGIGVGLLHITPSGVAGTEGNELETGDWGEYVDGGVRGDS